MRPEITNDPCTRSGTNAVPEIVPEEDVRKERRDDA